MRSTNQFACATPMVVWWDFWLKIMTNLSDDLGGLQTRTTPLKSKTSKIREAI